MSTATTTHILKVRSLYRRLLRELPQRNSSSSSGHSTFLASPSPLQRHIRARLSAPHADAAAKLDEVEQLVRYARAQRMYVTLLERYNPGMGMDERERVRLTARRVGMDMPEEWYEDGGAASSDKKE